MNHTNSAAQARHNDQYAVSDSVYVNENGQTYHGTVKEVAFKVNNKDPTKSAWKYHVHFTGWSTRHDRWLTKDNIHPDSEEMRLLAEESKKRLEEAKQKRKQKKAATTPSRKSKNLKQVKGTDSRSKIKDGRINSNSSRKRNRQQEEQNHGSPIKDHEKTTMTIDEYCSLPFTLKTILKDDETEMTRTGFYSESGYDPILTFNAPAMRVHALPAKITVDKILAEFTKVTCKDIKDEKVRNSYEVFARDMSTLFNNLLPKFLLYPCEREQYLYIERNFKMSPSDIYSGVHLLRMIVILPSTLKSLADLNNMEHDMKLFLDESGGEMIAELIAFIQEHSNSCLKTKNQYRFPNPFEYTDQEQALIEMTKMSNGSHVPI